MIPPDAWPLIAAAALVVFVALLAERSL